MRLQKRIKVIPLDLLQAHKISVPMGQFGLQHGGAGIPVQRRQIAFRVQMGVKMQQVLSEQIEGEDGKARGWLWGVWWRDGGGVLGHALFVVFNFFI